MRIGGRAHGCPACRQGYRAPGRHLRSQGVQPTQWRPPQADTVHVFANLLNALVLLYALGLNARVRFCAERLRVAKTARATISMIEAL